MLVPSLLTLMAMPIAQDSQEQPVEMLIVDDLTHPSGLKIDEDERVYRALDAQIPQGFEVRDTPLRKAVDALTRHGRISVLQFDSARIKEAGIETSEPVNLIFWDVTLRAALRALLEPRGLDFAVHNGRLTISTAEEVKRTTSLRSYDVSALLKDGEVTDLAAAVREQIPDTESQTVRISGYRNVLLVTGNRYVQECVQQTLEVLTKGLRDSAAQSEIHSRPTETNRTRWTHVSPTSAHRPD